MKLARAWLGKESCDGRSDDFQTFVGVPEVDDGEEVGAAHAPERGDVDDEGEEDGA